MMRGYGYYGDMMGGWGWGAWIAMAFFGLLVLAGLVLLVIWAIKASGHQQSGMPLHPGGMAGGPPHGMSGMPGMPPGTTHDEAVATVRRRYAAGELTKEQFDEMMQALGG